MSEVVRAASERAGLGSFGAHRLRHTAGTEMLRAGASLPEVAQVLGVTAAWRPRPSTPRSTTWVA
ncbi:MAG: tyrosine-type recombinase/integrase [Acidimicrobiales bacterium]